MAAPKLLWQPVRAGNTPIDHYRQHINAKFSTSLRTTHELQSWTVENNQAFWLDLYSYLNFIPPLPPHLTRSYDASKPLVENPVFFDNHMLNYAENALEGHRARDDAPAIIEVREGGDISGTRVSWGELKGRVAEMRRAMIEAGLKKGDVVAALVSNTAMAVVLFFATASVGAVFTVVNPDLGAEGCISRFQQVNPTLLFAHTHAVYKGKEYPVLPKVDVILSALPKKPIRTILIPYSSSFSPSDITNRSHTLISTFLSEAPPKTSSSSSSSIPYTRVPFHHPLMVCYSSGTTGKPKCIAHHHGLLLNKKKVSMLHNSLGPGETVLQYTNTSWVMFYIMMSSLASGATIIAYDGSPLYPDPFAFLRIAHRHAATYIGTSPRYLLDISRHDVPSDLKLERLKQVNTTGATLSAQQFEWFYSRASPFPPQVHLGDSAGGTDCATSLLCADPTSPVRAGQLQITGLGMDVDVLDATTGRSVKHASMPGEMVVRNAFPSMPAFFWGDADGSIYRRAYFEKFDGVWAQHDWMTFDPSTGGAVMHGRSDTTLNPSGIRFGSGEVYNVVEQPPFTTEHGVESVVCVGRRRLGIKSLRVEGRVYDDTDDAVFLFVVLRDGAKLTGELRERIRAAIRKGLSARHVPKFIERVKEVPVTINGKKVETAVKDVVSGAVVRVSETVVNGDCLKEYERFVEMESESEVDGERGML